MNVVTLKKKNICLILSTGLFVLYVIFQLIQLHKVDVSKKNKPEIVKCFKYLKWHSRKPGTVSESQSGKPIDILGPPGSGVDWFRFILEQLTGLHTGSTQLKYPDLFAGEERADEVLAVMSYDIDERFSSDRAAIVIYRNLQDTVRTHFHELKGRGAFVEAPLHSYYGPEWKKFALDEGKRWAARYASYFSSRHPIMVIAFDELDDTRQIQSQMLRLSNFVRVPIKHSALQCIMRHAAQFPLRPQPLKTGFQPFSILSAGEMNTLQKLENQTLSKMERARTLYRPNV